MRTVFENRIISRNSDVNWPPPSCNLTPLDNLLWGAVKNKCYANWVDGIGYLYTLQSSKLIVKLCSFRNASIEIKQISFVYQQVRFTVKKLICKIQNENRFTDKRFLLTLKRNTLAIKGLHLYAIR